MEGIKVYRYNPYFILPMVLFGLLMAKPVYALFYKLIAYTDYSGVIILILVIDYYLLFFVKHTYYVVKKSPRGCNNPRFYFFAAKRLCHCLARY